MRFPAVIAISLLWLVTATGAQAQTCQLLQRGSVEMHVTDGKVMLPVGIGSEQKDFEFSLAGALNLMSQELAEELKLPIHKLPRAIANSPQLAGSVTIPELRIGSVTVTNMEFEILTPAATAEGLNNTVGLGTFREVDLELDMGGKKLNFFSQDHCPGQAVYWTKEFTQVPFERQLFGYIRPQLELDGKPVFAALSLNHPSSIALGTMTRLFGIDENSPQLTLMETTPTGQKVYRYPFKSLGTEGLKIGNPLIRVTEGAANGCKPERKTGTVWGRCYGVSDLVMGYSVLSKLHIYLSLKERILYLSAADAH